MRRRIHIHAVELGSERAELHEAAGLGPLTSEAIYDPATDEVIKLDDSAVSLFGEGATASCPQCSAIMPGSVCGTCGFNPSSPQAPNIAGPNQSSDPPTG